MRFFLALLLPPVVAVFAFGDDSNAHQGRIIRSILAEKCIQCHGPDATKREADLRLDVEVTGDRQLSRLTETILARIESNDPDFKMPPPSLGKPLSDRERQQLRQWLACGARLEGHWSYQPIQKVRLKSGLEPSIDSLIDEALEEKGLRRSEPLSKSQWMRRVSIDLVGILPTWQEISKFEADGSDDAYAKVVDRLLASPLYGQRWGKYWLDVARYADTHGGAAIGFTSFPFSYTYRDYVIDAFNQDLPYDQFVLEQLAADQLDLPPNDPKLAALGFLTVGMRFRNEHDILDDQIDVVSRGLMGLTVACARCHDHKFDAIPTRDYYALYATLAASNAPNELPTIATSTNRVSDEGEQKNREAYFQKLDELKTQHDEMARDQIEIMKSRLRMQFGLYLRELAKRTAEQDVSTTFLSYRTDDIRPIVYNRWRAYMQTMKDTDPVFGIWHQMMNLSAEGFAESAKELIEKRFQDNETNKKTNDYHALGSPAPMWNPIVLEAIQNRKPASMQDVADAYGELFSRVHQEWLALLREMSLEATSSDQVVPDEDKKHLMANSPVYRQLRRHLYGTGTPTDIPDEVAGHLLNRTLQDSLGGKRSAIHQHHLNSPGSVPRAMVLQETGDERNDFIFLRGNHLTLGDKVKPGFLTALSRGTVDFEHLPGKRRLALAQAIISEQNPLTSRVIVNWIWQQHFGHGIVRSTDDFGTRGTPPSNAKLLDYLADLFKQDGGSFKRMHKRIVLSQTYRQAAVEKEAFRRIDPENDFLWRMPRRRLDFEAMRDSMLFVAGELDSTLGGRPIDLSATTTTRRTVYGFVNRDIVSHLSSTFDAANPNACSLKRPDTLVPQQTLFALNSEFIQDRAKNLVALMQTTVGSGSHERITWLCRRIYGRNPQSDEIEFMLRYVATEKDTNENEDAERSVRLWQSLAHALLASNEFSFVD